MEIKYNLTKLQKIIDDFSHLTNVRMNFCDSEGRILTKLRYKNDYCTMLQKKSENLEKCKRSDHEILERCKKSHKIESHVCYAGLLDLAMPIFKDGTAVGFLIMGRLRTPETKIDIEGYDIPFFSKSKLDSLVNLLPQILFESAIEIKNDSFTKQATAYIDSHLTDSLDVHSLCNVFHISKNCLYREFHEGLGCTVNEYVTKKRIDSAMQLLRKTKEPVYRIAEAVGIYNYTYFCRCFKKHTGLSPIQYRSNH